MPVIEVQNLRKTYGSTVAVDSITFEVQPGEVFGMVGPNGAGKTTTIECLEGLRGPDGGTISVLGMNPRTDRYALRERIGIQLQESALSPQIKVWEALDLHASFYANCANWHILLEQLGLTDHQNTHYTKLSGGQKQRLSIALALLNDPELIFLDELTTGLDPQGRRAVWNLVRDIRKGGKTVFLTTHYMEEVECLCDRVAIIDHGHIIALDSPANLIRRLGVDNRVVFIVEGVFALEPLQALAGVSRVEQHDKQIIVYGQEETLVGRVVHFLTQSGAHFGGLHTEQPTLEDVFLTLTGKRIKD